MCHQPLAEVRFWEVCRD